MPPASFNDWFSKLPGPEATLYVDLEDFQWPKDWQNEVELFVTQSLGDFDVKDTWNGTVKTNPVVVDLKRLRSPD